jgi:hypothetical protein
MMLKITFLLIVLTFANVSWSQSLTISSTGQTGTSGTNWSLASNVLTITGPADVNASVISGHLASNNLSLSGVVNISVNAAISWSTNTTLTLNASQNILVYRDITASGSSPELNIYYGGSNATTAPNNTYIYALSQRNRNKINFSSSSAVFRVGNETYSVVTNLSQLTQAMSNATSSTRVALGASISLSQTYTNSLFPINFEGKFDGLGQVIDGLKIRNSGGTSVKADLGLFSQLQGATVRNIGITNIDILTNSTVAGTSGSEFRIGALAGNIGNSSLGTTGYSASAYTSIIESVWSSGNIGTANDYYTDNVNSGDRQKFFFAGGLVGSVNNGTANISRCYSYCNVSSSGSYTDNIALGGLIGDVGKNISIPFSHITGTNTDLILNLSKSFTTGSILSGTYNLYYGTGGIIGVLFVSGSSVSDCYSWGSAISTGSFGGLIGYTSGGSISRCYTTQSTAGSISSATQTNNYTSVTGTSPTTLPTGFSNTVWSKASGELPVLLDLETPPTILYIKVTSGQSSSCGSLSINYTITNASGSAVSPLSSLGLNTPTGTPVFTINNLTPPGTYTAVSYLSGLTLTGTNAANYTLNPYPETTVQHQITGSCSNYQITFIGNSNTGGTTPANIVFTSSTTIPDQGTLVNSGSTFLGWNTAANGSGANYAAGATYSGTSNLTLYAQWVTVSSLGCVTIVASGGASENSTWVANYNTIRPNSSSNVNINASDIVSKLGSGNVKIMGNCITISSGVSYTTNTRELVLEANTTVIQNDAITLSGPVSMIGGGVITTNANITTSNASSISLLAKSGLRFNASGITLQTGGGAVVLSGDHDANNSGNIIAEGALTITTNGGAISMGGGATGTDFAYGIGTSGTIANDQTAGIWVRGAVNFNSGNGNISIRGYAANASPTVQHVPTWGVGLGLSAVYNTNPASVSINSGTGNILIEGFARNPSGSNSNSYGVVFNNWETTTTEALTITSANTTANAIRLIGNTENTINGQRYKNSLRFWSVNSNIRATGTGGGITLSGKTFDDNDHPQICWSGGNILATSGPIVINSEKESVEIASDLYIGSRSGVTGNTSSSSNICFSMDDFNVASGIIRVASTGSLTIEPFGSSFTDYTPTTNTTVGFSTATRWSLNENAQSLTGLTIGKPANTSNITIGSATTIAGPVTVYGGSITVNENLSTTNNGSIMLDAETGSQLTFNGNGITLATSKIIAAHGTGTVTILGRGGNASALFQCGVQLGSGSSLTTGGGNITIDGRGGNSGGDSHYGVHFAQGTNINIASNGGNISISGQGDGSGNNNDGINFQNTTILAGLGSITLDGKSKDDGLNSESLSFGTNNMAFGGATQTGNIIFRGDHVWSGGPATKTAQTSGTLTFEPFSNSFSSTQTYPFDVFTISSITGLNLGKSANTAGITIGSAAAVAGPVNVYGGTLTFNENLSSTVGGNISLYGNTLTFASGKTISSVGELLVAPQSASSSIGLAGATGTLQITSTHLGTNFSDGFSNIQIGSNTQTGNISANAFTLRDNMTFLTTGSLTLGGKPVLGNNNVTLGSAISSISGTPTHYFQTNGTGTVKRSIGNNTNLVFPIGNAFYNPLTITNNTGTLDDFSARVFDAVYLNGTSGNAITKPHVNATWDIYKTNANAGSGIDMQFSWDTAQERGRINNFILNHHSSGWKIAAGTTGTVSGTVTKTITHTGYTGSFSPFAFGNSATPLPVELISFNATCMNDFIQIKWMTASEKNNKMFELYKSDNAIDWSLIHITDGQGDKASETNYQFMDSKKQAAYYRLKDIDFDGIENWSQIIFADCESNASKTEIYPNPAQDFIKVITEIDEKTTLRILSVDGRILKTLPLISNQTLVDIKSLISGVYIVEIINQTSKTTFKINKI